MVAKNFWLNVSNDELISELETRLKKNQFNDDENDKIIRHYNSLDLVKQLNRRIKDDSVEKVVKVPKTKVNDDGTEETIFENRFLSDELASFFEKYFIKSTGKRIPDTPGAKRERSTSYSAPGFLFELEAQLKEDKVMKRGDRSNFVTKAWGIYLMTNYPNEWDELYQEYGAKEE